MKIKANNKEYEICEGVALRDFLLDKGFQPEKTLVSVNGEVVRAEDYQSLVLKEADVLELMAFVGGG